MNVGSLFSGIGGMDAGLARAGHDHVFFCEVDEWRREVLAARWPGVPIYKDVRIVGKPAARVAADGYRADLVESGREAGTGLLGDRDVGLLCGGFPCQDLSVAGKRAGLAGDRSGLFFEFARIIDAFRPRWLLLENVPGLLSSQGGRDFGVVLGTLAELGYGVGWRVLDSRFFGVPQRRRRVFIVGARADGDPSAAAGRAGEVLAVGSRCPGHPPTGGSQGARASDAPEERVGDGRVVGSLTSKKGGWRIGADEAAAGHVMPVAAPLTKGSASGEGVNAPGRRQEDDVNIVAFHPTGGGAKGLSVGDLAPGIGFGNGGQPAIAFDTYNQSVSEQTQTLRDPNGTFGDALPAVAYPLARRGRGGESELEVGEANVYNALRAGDGGSSRLNQVMVDMAVRRLTPVECERLQGLPDGWTRLDDKTPDSRRYSALGDAVTANVAEWIGERLARAELTSEAA